MASEDLIDGLVSQGVLQNPEIIEAFRKIDRKDFVLPELEDFKDVDAPLPIYAGQTISQPTTVAFMIELLEPSSGHKILDVGSGSGWTTALLAEIVGLQGQVLGVEKIPELVEFGRKNLNKYGFKNASIEQAGEKIGLPEKGPYDRIIVSAAAQSIPKELLDQLDNGGIMVIPIQNSILKIKKNPDGQFSAVEYPGFNFVPLVR